ncbi:MAG TPA: ATP-grasp domain-containing protein, partial [Nitrososphaerales archaeon]|nr:ATP-grasp domain-containing protein [Nitrososphaerales archaeon]
MRLFEYQAKDLLKSYGLQVPASILAKDVSEVRSAFAKLRPPVVLKAQVLAGGRGKAGGIVSVSDEAHAVTEAKRIFDLAIGGERPSSILVEESFQHEKEMYLSVTLDRGERSFVAIAAVAGGVDVESVSDKVVRKIPLAGIDEAFASEVAREVALSGPQAEQFSKIL